MVGIAADEPRNDLIEQVTLDAIAVVYQGHGAEFLKLDIATQGGEQMVSDGGFAAHLKILDVADLLDGAVVLFDVPMPIVLFGEGFPVDIGKLVIIG